MKYLIAFFLCIPFFSVRGQAPQVPHKLHFANMTLTIRDDARREIQKDVDALTQSPRHYNIKAERAKTYFPIIEQIFEEEGLPVDFKFLVLQESALISDAVSTSNAVGFWQFKDFTAIEMGLRVDREVDERMNIVSSSRAAARYLKKNNTFFDNWLYALQAYQMGAGGVMQSVKDFKQGTDHMEITSKTYWYVKKYLAHKIAFEDGTKGQPQLKVVSYQSKGKQTLRDIASDIHIDEEELHGYNKWLKAKSIPSDKTYAVIIPVLTGITVDQTNQPYLASGSAVAKPDVKANAEKQNKAVTKESRDINGLTALKVMPGESTASFARRADLDVKNLLKYNDMTSRDKVKAGAFYFTSRKRSRAEEAYHKVVKGETLWDVSQQYGVKLKNLRRFNRMKENESVKPGTMLYLSSKRPKNTEHVAPLAQEEIMLVDREETFDWEAEGKQSDISSREAEMKAVAIAAPLKAEWKVDSAEYIAPDVQAVDSTTVDMLVRADTVATDSPVQNTILSRQHVVATGETLYAIAKKYDVGVMDLVEWNELQIQDGIKPGQVLKLSDGAVMANSAPVEKEIVHTVKSSETLYSVARKYGVTIKEIMDWNGKSDFDLSVGEKLKIITIQ